MSHDIVLRPATRDDRDALWSIRYAVTENTLPPGRIGDDELFSAIEDTGRGWVAEHNGNTVGFAIGLFSGQVWALFIQPDHQGRGIGSALHSRMLAWFAEQPVPVLWLSTGLQTRARAFYLAHGWREAGPYGANEIRMERDNGGR